jgi:hypothetical protein
MSNFTAIAMVTAALSRRIEDAVAALIPGATATAMRPGAAVAETSPPHVNIFLYNLVPNGSLRNTAEPSRRSDGSLLRRPCAALDLHYLLTFVGDEELMEPERLAGAAITELTANPILQSGFIRQVIDDIVVSEGAEHFLAGSDLASQVERLRIRPLDLNLEALTNLWSSFTQAPYALSAGYEVSLVLMEANLDLVARLPVSGTPRPATALLRQPRVRRVASEVGPMAPIEVGSTLVITGSDLRGEHTRVQIGDEQITPAPEQTREGEIRVALSAFSPNVLVPGALGLLIRHLFDVDQGETERLRPGPSSNLSSFVLRPSGVTVTPGPPAAEHTGYLDLRFTPTPDPEWNVVLLLNENTDAEPQAYVLGDVEVMTEDDAIRGLRFSAQGVGPGEYLVRVQVNGAQSALMMGPDGRYSGPMVTIT